MNDVYDISMVVPGMPFHGDSLKVQSLGGSETAGLCLARELRALGHHVTMFCNTEAPGVYDGVVYRPSDDWPNYGTTTNFDITIIQRVPDFYAAKLGSKLNVLWCHDLAQNRNMQGFHAITWNVDKVFVLSQFMKAQYKAAYALQDTVVHETRNGIDLDAFAGLLGIPRNHKRLVYSARPERGLDILLTEIFPAILQNDPEVELCIAGYDNHPPQMAQFYEECKQLMARFGDQRVRHVGHLTKTELARLYASSGVYVYPTPSPRMPKFAEVSCISVMECMAAGLPVVTSRRGALGETLKPGAGTLIDGDPNSPYYKEKFVQATLEYMWDPNKHKAASAVGREAAADLSWADVAKDWTSSFADWFEERTYNPATLATHFIHRQDIIAAKECVKEPKTPQEKQIKTFLDTKYAFIESKKALKEHYLNAGKETSARLKDRDPGPKIFNDSEEPRLVVLKNEFKRDHPGRVLDYGCGHGWCDIYLHNQLDLNITGVDIDPGAVEASERFRDAYAKDASMLSFFKGDENINLSDQELYDTLLISEVMEHMPDPRTVAKLEKWVKPGGTVVITIPYGPWEYNTYNWFYFKNHIWEFDRHDIRDLFGKKKGYSVRPVYVKTHEDLSEPMGFHIIRYEADGKPLGKIDLDRKLRIQSPRQTVSATIIAGPNCEETLRWCLNSIKDVADELIVGNCGLSPSAVQILNEAGARIVECPIPTVEGFDESRNTVLKHATMDWVLWIDTDERLVDPQNLHKYLRFNEYNGYGINQHHFSIDMKVDPDKPVRLFRRVSHGGKSMRFFGSIHEHPEFALNEGPGDVVILTDAHIAHVGYLAESGRRKRFKRNRPLLDMDIAKYPDRLLQKHFICRDNMIEAGSELRTHGNQITPRIRQLCEETVEVFKTYFLGKSSLTNVNTIQYYSQALQMLNKGIDVGFQVAAAKDGIEASGEGPQQYRFENIDDAQVTLLNDLRAKAGQFSSEDW